MFCSCFGVVLGLFWGVGNGKSDFRARGGLVEAGECVGGVTGFLAFAEFKGAGVFVLENLAAEGLEALAHGVGRGFAAGDGLGEVVRVGEFDNFGDFEVAGPGGGEFDGDEFGEEFFDGAADEVATGAGVFSGGEWGGEAVVKHDGADDGGKGAE